MTRRLILSYLTITAFVLVVLVVPLGSTFADHERDELLADAGRDTAVVVALVEEDLENGRPLAEAARITEYSEDVGGRVVVVDSAGVAVLDTDPGLDAGRDFSTRPEFREALTGGRVEGSRRSETLGSELVFVAMPVVSGGQVHGAVRITFDTSAVDARTRSVWLRLGLLSGFVLGLVALVGLLLARGVTRPVRQLQRATDELAAGRLDRRVEETGPPEIRELAASFNRTAARLETLIDAQEHFVADASHQLRTPLTSLRLRLENLRATAEEPTAGQLDGAIEEVARMGRLVDGLLALARVGGDRLSAQPVDVAEAVRERGGVWAPMAEERAVRIAVDASEPALALALPGAVDQIVDNLVDNAVEFAPTGSTITLRVAAGNGRVVLHVIDEGPGLSAADRTRAMDRFWRGSDNQAVGSGLGLAIVDRLAKASGGSAHLDAGPDGGLDAVVELPVAGAG